MEISAGFAIYPLWLPTNLPRFPLRVHRVPCVLPLFPPQIREDRANRTSQFSLDKEALHPFEWSYSKIKKISDLECKIEVLGVGVALLTGLGGFETFADKLDLLFGLTKGIRSKQFAFSSF